MNEDEQWAKAVEIANEALQWVDYLAVGESLPEDALDEDVKSVYDKVHQLRANGDRHHTMQEMYRYRMLYNAHAAHGWIAAGIPVVKSWRHSDGELCFGGGWFIVTATLPTGQVSNHYEATHWDLFQVPEVDLPPEWDGHTPADAADRLERYLHDCTVDETAGGAETTGAVEAAAEAIREHFDPTGTERGDAFALAEYEAAARAGLTAALDVDEMARVLPTEHDGWSSSDDGAECECGEMIAAAGEYAVKPWRVHRARAIRAALLGGAA